MNDDHQVVFQTNVSGERLDKLVLDHLPGWSRVQVQALIRDGHVTVDGQVVKAGSKLKSGATIAIHLPEEASAPSAPQAETIPLAIVYEDDHLAVINKAAGMVVHPGVGHESGTLVNALLARYPQIAAMQDPDNADSEGRMGIVHRLDKDTSGLLIIAKTADALADLMAQFQERSVEKSYLALLERTPRTPEGVVDVPIGRDPKQRKRMAPLRGGKPATTSFEVIDTALLDERALVRLHLHTGRTHQIRVHMAFIGCPVVGDTVYGFRKQRLKLKRLFLHAAQIAFVHPVSGDEMRFEAPLPVGLQNILDKLRAH